MSKFTITNSFPTTLIKDFATYLEYCEKNQCKLTNTREFIGRKDVFALNELMSSPLPGVTNKNDQNHYPLLHMFYHLATDSQLFTVKRKSRSAIYWEPNNKKIKYFKSLSPAAQYIFLLKTLWVVSDWEQIQLGDGMRISIYSCDALFEFFSNRPVNQEIDLLAAVREKDGFFGLVGMGDIIKYLEFFGFWEILQLADYSTRTFIQIKSLKITPFGSALIKTISTSALPSSWNIPLRFSNGTYQAVLGVPFDVEYYDKALEAGKSPESVFKEWEKSYQPFEEIFQPLLTEKLPLEMEVIPPIVEQSGRFSFKVSLTYEPKIWRKVELNATNTLNDLHLIIQHAFQFDDDHLYAFHLDGNRFSKRVYYHEATLSDGLPGIPTNEGILGKLGLSLHHKMLYIFDFGDNWHFDVILEHIDEHAKPLKNPRIIEKKGKAPKQYDYDEDDDWW